MIEAMSVYIQSFSRFLAAVVLVGTVLSPAEASAQSATTRGHFFFYVAPVELSSMSPGSLGAFELMPASRLIHVGGGGEGFVTRRLGVGTDVGGIPHATTAGSLTVLSLNVFLHAKRVDHSRFDPFLTAGLSGFFSQPDHRTARLNAGAGINLHATSTVGLTLEYRQLGVSAREVRLGVTLWQ